VTTVTVTRPSLRDRAIRTFASLRVREFRYLGAGNLAASLAYWAHQIGTGWLVYDLTGSAAWLGTVTFVAGLIGLLATPIGGLLADRASRVRVVVLPALASTGLAACTAALILLDAITLWQVFALGIIGAVTNAIGLPARQALIHDVTTPETLPNAIALNSLVQNIARLAGPPLFGVLAAGSTSAPFLAVAVLHVVEATAMAPLGHRARRVAGDVARRRPFRDLIEGFRYVFSDRSLLSLFLLVLVLSLIAYGYLSQIPVFSEEVLGAGARGYGLLAAMAGLGSIVGLLVLASVNITSHRGPYMLASFAIHLAFVGAFSQSEHLLLAMACLAVGGAFLGIAFALYFTLFQLLVKDDMRGRALSVAQMAPQVLTLSALPVGLTVSVLGVQAGILAHVLVGAALAAAVAVLRPEWRRL
jgi:MFS family permease